MSKLSLFFRTLIKSSIDPSYYKELLEVKARFTWRYFLFFNLLAAFVVSIVIMIPVALFDLRGAVTTVSEVYPQDLEMTLSQGELSINQELPYVVPVPDFLSEVDGVSDEFAQGFYSEFPDYIVTFTTNDEFAGVQAFEEYDSFAVLTETTAYYYDDNDTVQITAVNYDEAEFDGTYTLTSETIRSLTDEFLNLPFLKNKWYVGMIGVATFVFLLPAMMLLRLFTILVYTVTVYVIARIGIKSASKVSYGKLYQLGMHSVTPVILVSWVVGLATPFQLSGWLYFFAYMGWTLFVLTKATADLAVVSSEVDTPPEAPKKPNIKKAKQLQPKKTTKKKSSLKIS